MRNFLPRISFLLLLAMLALTACEKDPISDNTTTEIPVTEPETQVTAAVLSRMTNNAGSGMPPQSTNGGLEVGCVSINFPFEIVADSVTYQVTDVNTFINLLEGPLETANFIDFVYPLALTLEDGSQGSAADEVELNTLVSDCVPSTGWTEPGFPAFIFDVTGCISLQYPVNLIAIDSSLLVANDENEFASILASNQLVFFDFPLTVLDSSGTVTTIADENDLLNAIATCEGSGGPHCPSNGDFTFLLGADCYTFNYPLNFLDEQGNVISVANDDDFINALLAGLLFDFVYPFDVTLDADGSTVTINDETEFLDLFITCGFTDPSGGGGSGNMDFIPVAELVFLTDNFDCLEYVYPIVAISFGTGDTTVLNSDNDAMLLMQSTPDALASLPFDFTVDGTLYTANTIDDLFSAVGACQGGGGGGSSSEIPATIFILIALDSSATCYDLVYPFDVNEPNGTTVSIASQTDAENYIMSGQNGEVAYPVDVFELSTSTTVTLTEAQDYIDLIEDCQ